MLHFYSQNMEDYFLYRNFFNKKVTDGIFVELGSMDGITYSNTLFFEKFLGYKGLLIEPVPHLFSNLIRNRKNNFLENYAISDKIDKKLFIGDNACAGLEDTMAHTHIEKYHKHLKKIIVDTIPIKNLIEKHNIKYIDFFSIDVEGGELQVLETMNWDIPVYIICIELDRQNNIKDENCRKILINNNFKFMIRISNNEFYINDNYFRKELLYDKNFIKDDLTFYNTNYKTHHFTGDEDRKRFYGELDFYNKIINFENS